tara:strand:- start:895 stop:1074 length:180 start_codon:yes stop_codon:yes gene_type:complete
MRNKKEIQEISRNWNMSEENAKKLLEEVSKPSLDNTHCDFDKKSDIGVGASDQPVKHHQ